MAGKWEGLFYFCLTWFDRVKAGVGHGLWIVGSGWWWAWVYLVLFKVWTWTSFSYKNLKD